MLPDEFRPTKKNPKVEGFEQPLVWNQIDEEAELRTEKKESIMSFEEILKEQEIQKLSNAFKRQGRKISA
jgi:hypothetical protein